MKVIGQTRKNARHPHLNCILAALLALRATAAFAEGFIVQDGKPRAEIIIAEKPPRTVKLAAQELRTHVEKISGAKLPIATAPSQGVAHIYVGKSAHTDRLGVKADDLKYGAFRMKSGKDWLALIGRDSNFTPIEPWPRSHTDWTKGEVLAQWDNLTGAHWGNPMQRLYKRYTGRARDFGKPQSERRDKSDTIHVWAYDERGSFNAVCGFLRSLGVRWYMPGELGEVVPTLSTIALPDVDETVRPDFPMRRFSFSFGVQPREVAMWAMRLGVFDPYGFQVAHGLKTLTDRDEMKKAYPEYYALYGGKRANNPNQRYNHLCLSSEGLFRENVRYVRTLFDHYKMEAVSVMPTDAFTAICQCPLCEGKDTPERGYRGRMSDYVWDYVNRVAKEVAKTHPDKKIVCLAYGSYQQPPLKIDKLHPNVQVGIVGGRRPTADLPEQRKQIRALRQAWLAKTDNKIFVFENYPFTHRGYYLPSFVPHTNAASINATKGISWGEDIWLSILGDFDTPGYNHFKVYFTARMYWGGKERDIDALLNEYYRLFYGPAEKEMKTFFEYCEANWRDVRKDRQKLDRTFELFAAAQQKVEADSVYRQRIALLADFLQALKKKGEQLAEETKRKGVPELRTWRGASPDRVRIDGKLDEDFWLESCPTWAGGHLRELQTGREPMFTTHFKVAWGREDIYFAIRCEDRAGDTVNIGTKRNEDPAIWYGDVVEILLETEKHSYYQIAINPAGAIADLDREASKANRWQWSSQAEVATHVGEDYWTVEVRIPVVEKTNDPLHQVVGREPLKSLPWYFNVCRQRMRENRAELSAFSPTGEKRFHNVTKFGKLYVK